MKHSSRFPQSCGSDAAAFGRLCVETPIKSAAIYSRRKAAAFGRLCVETLITHHLINVEVAAAFGRLCVETNFNDVYSELGDDAAAFGRLCVETGAISK